MSAFLSDHPNTAENSEYQSVQTHHDSQLELPVTLCRVPFLPEMECTGGQVYEACGSVCQRTCRSLSGLEPDCKLEKACEEGCFCPAGKYLSDSGECVTADLCTCLHDGQLYQPNDIYADHNSIWSVTVLCSGTSKAVFPRPDFYF